jgi:hypothetical protein
MIWLKEIGEGGAEAKELGMDQRPYIYIAYPGGGGRGEEREGKEDTRYSMYVEYNSKS